MKQLDPKFSAITAFDQIMQAALEAGSSDVHVEPFETGLHIRFRVDGQLIPAFQTKPEHKDSIVARIKILSNLDIAEKRRPQDGRIRYKTQAKEIDLRVSVIPVYFGEKVVIRILDPSGRHLDFASLGFPDHHIKTIQESLSASNGLILVTGPTGSGKSTTLYTALQYLNKPDRNILTIEDPVEYHIAGINQSAANEEIGYTFAHALRSFLRQDPNIIMVGEIRDLETAEIAIRASLTGHLVLSTLHTNDAPATLSRLLDMGVENYLLISTLRLIVSQRLVRILCPACKKKAENPSPLAEHFLSLNQSFLPERKSWQISEPVGCESCRHTGYKSRTVVTQLLPITESVRNLMIKNGNPSEFGTYLDSIGEHNLFVAGLNAIVSGRTTIEEVVREAM
ncbi:MAG: GspE/PulE family protein [Bacteroidetes bacterium]|nr:GspE/PulE family protein [Bacteroidota bacterium]